MSRLKFVAIFDPYQEPLPPPLAVGTKITIKIGLEQFNAMCTELVSDGGSTQSIVEMLPDDRKRFDDLLGTLYPIVRHTLSKGIAMKTYYFCAVSTSDTRMIRSFYTVHATHFSAAVCEVMRQTEWSWSQQDYSFELLEFCVFGFARQKAKSQVEAIVLGRNGVNA